MPYDSISFYNAKKKKKFVPTLEVPIVFNSHNTVENPRDSSET